MNIGERIRRLRKARKLTLEELARTTALSQPFLSQIERDIKNPSVETLSRICDALGVTLAEFFSPGSMEPDADRLVVVARRLTSQQRELLARFLEQMETVIPEGEQTGSA
jgi:transcriptional regulator with XRE-family HTH domain